MTMAANQAVQFTMKFDPADLSKLSQMIVTALGRPAGNAAASPAGAATPTQAQQNTRAAIQKKNSESLLKALLQLEVLKKLYTIVAGNSTVANTYLGAMGKMFGAAIDLLLIPFTPIFNLILVGLAKLIEWLSRADVQKQLEKIANYLLSLINGVLNGLWPILKDIYNIINAIVHGDLSGLWNAVKELGSDLFKWLTEGSPIVVTLKLILAALVASKVAGLAGGILGATGVSGVGSAATGALGLGGLATAGAVIASAAGLASMTSEILKPGSKGGGPWRWGQNELRSLMGKPELDYASGSNGRRLFGIIPTYNVKGNAGTYSPTYADNGVAADIPRPELTGPQQNIQITMNVNSQDDAKLVADRVREELDKIGRSLRMR